MIIARSSFEAGVWAAMLDHVGPAFNAVPEYVALHRWLLRVTEASLSGQGLPVVDDAPKTYRGAKLARLEASEALREASRLDDHKSRL